MTGPIDDDAEAFADFAQSVQRVLREGLAQRPVDIHQAAAEEAWRLDTTYFRANPDATEHVRRAVDHEVCVARGWCQADPLADLAPCPEGMTRELVAIVKPWPGGAGGRRKDFRAQLVPIGGET